MKSFYLFTLFCLFLLSPSCLLAEDIRLIDWPNECAGPGGGSPCDGAPQFEGACCPGNPLLDIQEIGGVVCLTGGVPPYYVWDDVNNTWTGIDACPLPSDPVDCPYTSTYNDSCGIIDNTDGEGISYGPPVNPHDPLTLTGPEDVVVGSQYAASGGSQPYSWSISCGTIDPDTGVVLSDDTCCSGIPDEINEVEITVTDSCGNSASMQARGKGGSWKTVDQSSPSAPGWPTNYIRQIVTDGPVRNTYYYTGCDCFYSQEMTWSPGGCMGFNYYSNDGSEPADAVQWNSTEICGESPPNPWTNLEGSIYRYGVSSSPGWCDAWKNQYQIYGWSSYCKNPNYFKVEHWVCQ